MSVFLSCIKCGRNDDDRPCGKYCGNGDDKDNSHDWRDTAKLTDAERARMAANRERRVAGEKATAERETRYENRLRAEGAAAERAAVVAYLRSDAGMREDLLALYKERVDAIADGSWRTQT